MAVQSFSTSLKAVVWQTFLVGFLSNVLGVELGGVVARGLHTDGLQYHLLLFGLLVFGLHGLEADTYYGKYQSCHNDKHR